MPKEFEEQYNDTTNAIRFVKKHGINVKYSEELGCWLVWNGSTWKISKSDGYVKHLGKDIGREIFEEIKTDPSGDLHAANNFFRYTSSNRGIKNMLSLAQTEPVVVLKDINDFDSDPELLNCINGTINLRTAELWPHDREYKITKILPFNYSVDAKCPRWLEFLDQIMEGDKEMIEYLRLTAGYILTGYTREQCLFLFYGDGANGKSVYIETLVSILGEYHKALPVESLMSDRKGKLTDDLASIRGARLVSTGEVAAGHKWNESMIKDLTSGDKTTARKLFGEYFDFNPIAKIVMRANYKPIVNGTDNGIWRRLKVIPFNRQFKEHEQDKNLLNQILNHELEGILAWAVNGSKDYLKYGLTTPSKVTQQTEEYRKEENTIGRFLDESCKASPGQWVKASVAYDAYKKWCEQIGAKAQTLTMFGRTVFQHGIEKEKKKMGWVYLDISLVTGSQ